MARKKALIEIFGVRIYRWMQLNWKILVMTWLVAYLFFSIKGSYDDVVENRFTSMRNHAHLYKMDKQIVSMQHAQEKQFRHLAYMAEVALRQYEAILDSEGASSSKAGTGAHYPLNP